MPRVLCRLGHSWTPRIIAPVALLGVHKQVLSQHTMYAACIRQQFCTLLAKKDVTGLLSCVCQLLIMCMYQCWRPTSRPR